MGPVNMYVGTQDPLLNNQRDLDEQLKLAEQRLAALQEINKSRNSNMQSRSPIWDTIDREVEPLTQDQRIKLQNNESYLESYTQLNSMVQSALVDLVKGTIENSEEGKRILEEQLRIIRELKGKIIEDSNKEMELFRKFKEFSKSNPDTTYEDFLKTL